MTRFHAMAFAAFGLIGFSVQASAQVGDATRGERMYRACLACHSLEPNRNMTGPSLAEVWNRSPDRCRASRATPPRSNRPGSSGPTTRSTNGSKTRSTSFPETP